LADALFADTPTGVVTVISTVPFLGGLIAVTEASESIATSVATVSPIVMLAVLLA